MHETACLPSKSILVTSKCTQTRSLRPCQHKSETDIPLCVQQAYTSICYSTSKPDFSHHPSRFTWRNHFSLSWRLSRAFSFWYRESLTFFAVFQLPYWRKGCPSWVALGICLCRIILTQWDGIRMERHGHNKGNDSMFTQRVKSLNKTRLVSPWRVKLDLLVIWDWRTCAWYRPAGLTRFGTKWSSLSRCQLVTCDNITFPWLWMKQPSQVSQPFIHNSPFSPWYCFSTWTCLNPHCLVCSNPTGWSIMFEKPVHLGEMKLGSQQDVISPGVSLWSLRREVYQRYQVNLNRNHKDRKVIDWLFDSYRTCRNATPLLLSIIILHVLLLTQLACYMAMLSFTSVDTPIVIVAANMKPCSCLRSSLS